MQEIWKESSVPGYFISNLGRILGRSGKIMKSYLVNNYLQIVVRLEGKGSKVKALKIHREVAKAFIPNPNNLKVVNHKDGNKLNNSANNLEWCTDKENVQHAYKTGLACAIKGSNNIQSKLTMEEVRYIRKNYIPKDFNFGCRGLARKFNVSHKVIYKIIQNKSYIE